MKQCWIITKLGLFLTIILSGCATLPSFQKGSTASRMPEYEIKTTEVVSASYPIVWAAALKWFQMYRLPMEIQNWETGSLSTKTQTYPNWKERLDCGAVEYQLKAAPVVKITASLQPVNPQKTMVTLEVWGKQPSETGDVSAGYPCTSKGILEKNFFEFLRHTAK